MGNIHLPIPTYLVSMDREFMRRIVLGVKYDYRYAVDGLVLDIKILEKKGVIGQDFLEYNKLRKLRKGEIGCYLSHVHMINKAIKSGKDYVLIIEDDAKIPKDIDINKIINEAPKDFQILFIGYKFFEHFDYDEVNTVHGTHAYIINTKNLKNTRALFPITEPIDLALSRIYKSYIITPTIVGLNAYSKISTTNMIK
jgi:hypothetical protein